MNANVKDAQTGRERTVPALSRKRQEHQVEILAARLRVKTDRGQGKSTPVWVKDLAKKPL